MKMIMFFVLAMNFYSIQPGYSVYFGSQKPLYSKNNNRIVRQKYAHINMRIQQPRKHNHEPRCNERRNQ